MTRKPCTHGTADDHCTTEFERPAPFALQTIRRRLWTCTACSRQFEWPEDGGETTPKRLSPSYFGTDECPHCSRARIDAVACSTRCRNALVAARPDLKETP